MHKSVHEDKGNLIISLLDEATQNHTFSVKIPDCSVSDAFQVAGLVAKQKSLNFTSGDSTGKVITLKKDFFKAKKVADSVVPPKDTLNFSEDTLSTVEPDKEIMEEVMSDFTKSELQAHLNANKAEVNAVAASMKKDMAEWREQMRSDLREVKDAINSQKNALDQHIYIQKTQLDTHIQLQKSLIEKEFSGQSLKLDTSIKLQTAGLQESLSAVKLDVTRWVVGLILGVPSILFTLYKIFQVLSTSSGS